MTEFEISSLDKLKDMALVRRNKKLSESPGTFPIMAKLCKNDSKNRKIEKSSASYAAPWIFGIVIIMEKSGENENWS